MCRRFLPELPPDHGYGHRWPPPVPACWHTEGENGHRDYYWGRYGNSQAWAQRDFDRRVDDYQQLYHAAVKNTELGPEGVYRYYSTQRPVDIGTYFIAISLVRKYSTDTFRQRV